MARTGRPTAFKLEYVEQARKLCELGATDVEMADFFKVAVSTFYKWKNAHADFSEALKAGKALADERVERSLFHRAVGYTFDAVKIFMPAGAKKPVYAPYREHCPPDTTAMIFWLKNRRPSAWRVEDGGGGRQPDELPLAERLKTYARAAAIEESEGRVVEMPRRTNSAT